MEHRIINPILELSFIKEKEQESFLQEGNSLFYGQLLPVMEEVMDDLSGEEVLVRYERVEIDLGTLQGEGWREDLKNRLRAALKARLEGSGTASLMNDEGKSISKEENHLQSMFFYLRNGYLPWWSANKSAEDLISLCIGEYPSRLVDFLVQERENVNVMKRLVSGMSEEDVQKFMENNTLFHGITRLPDIPPAIKSTLPGSEIKWLRKIMLLLLIREPDLLSSRKDNKLLAKSFRYASGDSVVFRKKIRSLFEEDELPGDLREIITDPDLMKEDETEMEGPGKDKEGKDQKPRVEEAEPVYINNAGLILVYPFLAELFKNFGLLEEGKFKDAYSRERAVWLTAILTGETGKEEHHVLNKVLCGMKPEQPLFSPAWDDEEAVEAADDLLRAVASAWPTMERTSPEAIRETWLLREGKLEFGPGKFSLLIERKTVDIMLDKIPWPLSIIQLPWMDEILYVRW